MPFRNECERLEAQSLIRCLARIAENGTVRTAASAVMLEELAGGRSTARIFKMTPLSGAGRRAAGTPVVVKIAALSDGLREKANYEAFVHSGLAASCRADLLGFAETRSLAGLCYSYAGGRDSAAPETLTDHLQRGDTDVLEMVLRSVLHPLRDTWYCQDAIREECDIARRYLDRFFTPGHSALADEATLSACAARHFDAKQEGGRYRIANDSFPSLCSVLFANDRKRRFHSCILHGDLNSDNIVVAPDRTGAILVDFQKTGRGHVYQDLAFLEASIRINYPLDASIDEILETERSIAREKPPPRETPYTAAIHAIRSTAFRMFGHLESQATYHFAMAALGLRLMRIADLPDLARARIAASALWATKVLAEESRP